MACRVVCGRLLTMPTFSPTIALVRVVFPALGRPTRAAKPLRWDGCSGRVTPSSLPLPTDATAGPGRCAHLGRWRHAFPVPTRARRAPGRPGGAGPRAAHQPGHQLRVPRPAGPEAARHGDPATVALLA